jgi:hypothetical protein
MKGEIIALIYRSVRANSVCKKKLEVSELFFGEHCTSLIGIEALIHKEEVIEHSDSCRAK